MPSYPGFAMAAPNRTTVGRTKRFARAFTHARCRGSPGPFGPYDVHARIRLAGARARAVRSGQASEPSSAASLGKNGYGDPAAAPLEPDGSGPTQPKRSGGPRTPSEVVPRQGCRPRVSHDRDV